MVVLNLSVVQLLLAFGSATILRRLVFNRFFLTWISIYNLNYYVPPSDEKLRNVWRMGEERKAADARRARRGNRGSPPAQNSPPRRAGAEKNDFELEVIDFEDFEFKTKIMTLNDLEQANFSHDLEWIGDLAFVSLFCYFLTNFQFFFFPNPIDYNFGILWALMVVMQSCKILIQFTIPYFKHTRSVLEKAVVAATCGGFFVIAMLLMTLGDDLFDFGLETAYNSINTSPNAFIGNRTLAFQDHPPTRPFSFLVFKIIIALFASSTGLIFAISGLRFGQLHNRVVNEFESWEPLRMVANLAHYTPLMVVALWFSPVVGRTIKFLFMISNNTYDTFRVYCILLACALRFFMLPYYLQTFLLSIDDKMNNLRRQGGTTTCNTIKFMVSSVNGHINITALQYVLPVFISCYFTFIYKNLGGLSWLTDIFNQAYLDFYAKESGDINRYDELPRIQEVLLGNVTKLAPEMMKINELKMVFNPQVCKSVLGFMTFWLQFAWCVTSYGGLYIHQRFNQ